MAKVRRASIMTEGSDLSVELETATMWKEAKTEKILPVPNSLNLKHGKVQNPCSVDYAVPSARLL